MHEDHRNLRFLNHDTPNGLFLIHSKNPVRCLIVDAIWGNTPVKLAIKLDQAPLAFLILDQEEVAYGLWLFEVDVSLDEYAYPHHVPNFGPGVIDLRSERLFLRCLNDEGEIASLELPGWSYLCASIDLSCSRWSLWRAAPDDWRERLFKYEAQADEGPSKAFNESERCPAFEGTPEEFEKIMEYFAALNAFGAPEGSLISRFGEQQ